MKGYKEEDSIVTGVVKQTSDGNNVMRMTSKYRLQSLVVRAESFSAEELRLLTCLHNRALAESG